MDGWRDGRREGRRDRYLREGCGFSSLMKQKIKGKNCAVLYIAEFFYKFFFRERQSLRSQESGRDVN